MTGRWRVIRLNARPGVVWAIAQHHGPHHPGWLTIGPHYRTRDQAEHAAHRLNTEHHHHQEGTEQ